MGVVDRLWPVVEPPEADPIELYDYPPDLQRPFVRANFVCSVDGAVTLEGHSGGLSDRADRDIFALQRAMADVIMVGAGTARAEGYRGARISEEHAALRRKLGLPPVPPIAIITATCWLTSEHVLVTDTAVPPMVITVASAPIEHMRALADAGVPVLIAGEHRVDPATALQMLDEHGMRRILTEGGPELFGDLVAADLVDELCLTISPRLVGGTAGRIVHTLQEVGPRTLRLASALHAEDALLLRYRRNQVEDQAG
ncbi:MAG TPA: pyrimidine reductase family protein [Pseudonocardiaceae bacterium]|jgi:5-amino-6-(5-phosphoribosylamino)uracil reductase